MTSWASGKTGVPRAVFILIVCTGLMWATYPGKSGAENTAALEGFLYFGDSSGRYLSSVEHRLSREMDSHELAVSLISALIQGPPQGLNRTLPRETRVNALFIDPAGIAYIDLDDTLSRTLPQGAEAELLAVYSMVNTLVLNIPGIKQVKFLVQGTDVQTFTGHMDLGNFFRANMLIIR